MDGVKTITTILYDSERGLLPPRQPRFTCHKLSPCQNSDEDEAAEVNQKRVSKIDANGFLFE